MSERIALVFEEREYSAEQLERLADGLATTLAKRGARAGDRIALMASNRAEWVVAVRAIWRLGAAVVLFSPAWKRGEVEHALAITEPAYAVGDHPLLAEAMPMLHLDEPIEPGEGGPGLESDLGADAALVFSSGTTGLLERGGQGGREPRGDGRLGAALAPQRDPRHRRGRFDDEILPIETPHGLFSVDEHPRRGTSMEKLASLKPLHPEIEGFSITPGNASGANDGAAALVVASDRLSDRLGLPALATVRSWASVGVDPAQTGLAPVKAIPKALSRAGLTVGDVDLFEINEAFAAMCVATIRLLDLDAERVNVSGSGCSLGHPVAATGARMIVTLVHELRRRGGGIGVAGMCAGGGMGSATVIEVNAPR